MSAPSSSSTPEVARRRLPILLVVLLGVALLLALSVATNVLGVLFAIAVPPMPPVPDGAREVAHTNYAYGVDTWDYHVTSDGCVVAQALVDTGATCRLTPLQCSEMLPPRADFSVPETLIARCVGTIEFSVFTMQWAAVISRLPDQAGSTLLQLEREIFWIGSGRAN